MYTPQQKRQIEAMAEKYRARVGGGRFRLVWAPKAGVYLLYRYGAGGRLEQVDCVADENEMARLMQAVAIQARRENTTAGE